MCYSRVTLVLLSDNAWPGVRAHGGLTPLHAAAHVSHADLVPVLLAHATVASPADDKGRTPAARAARASHNAVAALLPALLRQRESTQPV